MGPPPAPSPVLVDVWKVRYGAYLGFTVDEVRDAPGAVIGGTLVYNMRFGKVVAVPRLLWVPRRRPRKVPARPLPRWLALGRFMPSMTGGLACDHTKTDVATTSRVVGAGVEYAIRPPGASRPSISTRGRLKATPNWPQHQPGRAQLPVLTRKCPRARTLGRTPSGLRGINQSRASFAMVGAQVGWGCFSLLRSRFPHGGRLPLRVQSSRFRAADGQSSVATSKWRRIPKLFGQTRKEVMAAPSQP
jgi:hypothetical protein